MTADPISARLSVGGFTDLDRATMAHTIGGGSGVDRVLDLATDALRHAGSCISNNWKKFKQCFRAEMNR